MNARATAADGLDYLDQALVVWAREIPDLDPLTEGIVERIHILAHELNVSSDETLAEFDLDRRSFKLLSRLRSFGPPYQRSAGMLANDMQLSSGAMTNRLDRMEAAGLIRRLPDPNDRRGTLVEPTEAGHAAWDQAVGTQARREAMIAAVLTDDGTRATPHVAAPADARLPGQGPRSQARDRRRDRGPPTPTSPTA